MTERFLRLLAGFSPIIADGAMGTMLIAAGLRLDEPPEAWNIDPAKRDRVRAVHRAYLRAGTQVLLTNSFGGNPFRLQQYRLQARVFEINRAAAELARAEAQGAALVAGTIGPTGAWFTRNGALSYEMTVDGFAAQVAGLAAGGVDVIWIETMGDLHEIRAAIEGAQRSAPQLPIVATMTFDGQGRTLLGVPAPSAARDLAALGLAAIGANCGTGPDAIEAVIATMHAVAPDVPLIAKSNAGLPEIVDERTVYHCTPDMMAIYARNVHARGATIIGACCGSTPAHIRAIAAALRCTDHHSATG